MRKGLSPIISAILILLIAISVTLLAVIWLPKFVIKIFPLLGFNESYIRSRGCLSIENVYGLFGLFTVKNCGKVALSDFSFFIDGKFINKLNIGTLEPSQSINFYDMPITGGRHNLYITADYAESPPYAVDVPYWECTGGEPVLISDWYVSKNISCICSYNTIIPVNGNLYVRGNGSLSFNRCTIRTHGLFVRDMGVFSSDKCLIYFYLPVPYPKFLASNNATVIMVNTTVDQDSGAYWTPFTFTDNSTNYLNYTTVTGTIDVRGESKNFYNNSHFTWFGLNSNVHHNLTIDDFHKGEHITDYIYANGSNFKINFINTDALYPTLSVSSSSSNNVTNSDFHQLYIYSNINHSVNITNFRGSQLYSGGTFSKNNVYAIGSDFKLNLTNLGGVTWVTFSESEGTVSNNTIYNSSFNSFDSRYLMSNYNITNSDWTSTYIYTWGYNNPNFTANITNSYIGSLRLGYGYSVLNPNINLTFSNSIFSNFNTYDVNNSNIKGNVTITGSVGTWDDSNITRYFPTIIKDSNNYAFPTGQPAIINITNKFNQSVWLGPVSGGSTPINYYIDNPNILFNASNYGPGNFSMRVSQVCENMTNITFMSNTSLEFTINRSYNYDGTSFSTLGNIGLSFDNSNFWAAAAGGNVYKYDKTGGYVSSFNSGLNVLRDVSSNGTYLWLLNYNSTEKRVYRYLPSGTYDNFFFDIPEVVEPYAVDFDGESFWVLGNTSVYKYNITGGYTGFSFNLDRLPGVYYGDIVSSSGKIWILTENYSSSNGRGVFRYNSNGTYDNWYFDIAPTTTTGRGLAFNGTYFWVMNSAGTVFRYGFNRNCLDFMKSCDEFITFLPYTISKNNTRYCMLYSLYAPGQTAITFANNVKNSTLDCQWYNIGGNGAASTVGIYLTGANNNTINNCNINSFDNGINIFSSTNNLITNTNANANSIGIVVTLSSNNTMASCSINGNSNNDYYLASLGMNNNFANTNFTDYRTIYFYDPTSWFNYQNDSSPLSNFGKTDIGSSITTVYEIATHVVKFSLPEAGLITKITAYVSGAWGNPATIHAGIYDDSNGNPNNLKGTTSNTIVSTTAGWYDFIFSTPVSLPVGTYHIGLYSPDNDFVWYYSAGSTAQYHYNVWSDFPNQWSGGSNNNWSMSIFATYTPNIWLKTSVSAQAQLTRKLVNWNDALIQWKDTSSTAITTRYNVTGLVPGAPYSVYDNLAEIVNSPIKTDSSGAFSFTINLPASQEHSIIVKSICDYYIYNSSIPFTITQNNSYYCLVENVSRSSSYTAINFSPSVQNSTLDCVNNYILGRGWTDSYGVFSKANNSIVKNCNITNWYYGFYALNSSYDTLYNNSFVGNRYANVYFDSNSNNANIIKNNISSAVNYYGLVASKNNIIINNTINNNPDRGIAIDSNNILINNTIKYSRHGIDISGSNNTFVNNNIFTYHTYSSMQQAIYFVWESKNNISESNNINGLPILFVDGTARPCVNNTVYTNGSSYGLMGFIGCKNITIRDSSPTDGLYFGTIANLTLYNLTINFTQRAIQIENEQSSNVNINNNTINGAAYNGIYDHFAHGSTISNNNINCYGGTAGIMIYGGGNDILNNNTFTNCSFGYWIYSAVSNNVKGGSAHGNLVDYGFSSPGTGNFTNTNFTDFRKVQLDTGSWFNYNNETNGNIWLNTSISTGATLTRKLLSWNQNLMKWNDTSDTAITASYNVLGLLPSTCYNVYSNSALTYNLYSDPNGQISFTINMPASQSRNITVNSVSCDILILNFNEAIGKIAHDYSGYGNDGTFIGETFNDGTSYSGVTPTDLHTASGVYGKALSFDGINDFANVSDSNSLDVDSITITAWIYPLSFGGGNTLGRIVDKAGSYLFYVANDSGQEALRFYLFNSTVSGSNDSNSHSINLNAWQHVAVTYDSQTIRFYVNGTPQGSFVSPAPGPLMHNSNSLYVGDRINHDRQFNGTIDELRIWDRTLSQAEINEEMQSSRPITRPNAAWSFEESGQYVNDTHIWVNGTYGSALSFDGVNDYIEIPHDNSISGFTDAFTASFWIKQYNVTRRQALLSKYNDLNYQKGWFVDGPSNVDDLGFFAGRPNGIDYSEWHANHNPSIGTWYYITVVWKADQQAKFYVNGVPYSTSSSTLMSSIYNNIGISLFIGKSQYNPTRYLDGVIDEIRLWAKALTTDEINTEMNRG